MYSPLLRITSPFIPLLICFVSFYNVKRAKRSTSRGKIQRFVAPDRSKMIHFKIGDPKSRNGGTEEWWKITPNPKTWNGGKSL